MVARSEDAYRFLVIDDDPAITELIQDLADSIGYVALAANRYDRFLSIYEQHAVSAILLDLQMPGVDGVEYLRVLGERACKADIIVMSGHDSKVLEAAVRLGREHGLSMLGGLQKPIAIEKLRECLNALIRTQSAKRAGPAAIAAAIENQEFQLYYQPKVRLRENAAASSSEGASPVWMTYAGGRWQLDSFEALSRWFRPVGGPVLPDEFIPLIENQGQMPRFTDHVIENLVRQLYKWETSGFLPSAAFNLSPVEMTDLSLPDRLSDICLDHGLANGRIIVEITETAAMTDIRASMDILSRLRLKGFRVAMDDFGTGFSSLVQLHRMPFTELKIDKSIIAEIDSSDGARTIARSIIDLAHNLGLEVCAEGVENEVVLQHLMDFGCDSAQGYHFSPAVRASVAAAAWANPAAKWA